VTVQLFIPYSMVLGNGTQIATSAPLVDSLPTTPSSNMNLILTGVVGTFAAGAYQWVPTKSRWQFIVDYQTICSQLFGVSNAFLCFPNAGDNFLPVGPYGQAQVAVYRNGGLQPTSAYTLGTDGVHLVSPALAADLYLVIMVNPMRGNTPISGGGGGISDAPNDGNPYVRNSLAWEQLQNELNEGQYSGH
jgi:hypothetical protein